MYHFTAEVPVARTEPLKEIRFPTFYDVKDTNWIDSFVAVGGLEDAFSVHDLRKADIDLIIDARTLFDETLEAGKKPILDKIIKAGDMLVAITEYKPKVLVHCLLGIDRTPFVAMVYVSKKYDTSYKDAYEFVKKKHPHTVFHWDWVEMLRAWSPRS